MQFIPRGLRTVCFVNFKQAGLLQSTRLAACEPRCVRLYVLTIHLICVILDKNDADFSFMMQKIAEPLALQSKTGKGRQYVWGVPNLQLQATVPFRCSSGILIRCIIGLFCALYIPVCLKYNALIFSAVEICGFLTFFMK